MSEDWVAGLVFIDVPDMPATRALPMGLTAHLRIVLGDDDVVMPT
jgi:hypothetical protein